MLEKFINEKFNGNKEEAIKCIATELATMKYKVTKSQTKCRDLASELRKEDRERAYKYFVNDVSRSKMESKIKSFNISKNQIKLYRLKKPIARTAAIAGLATIMTNAHLLFSGNIPFTDAISITSGVIISLVVLRKIIVTFNYKAVRKYVNNEELLAGRDVWDERTDRRPIEIRKSEEEEKIR